MIIDLRSDTVTKPTPAMLAAMMAAEVGDDVFGGDPTVNALQEKAAAMFGMEAALFCPSGTMTNQIAFRIHTTPGAEVILEENAHPYRYEGGGLAVNSGLSVALLQGDRGRITAEQVRARINPDDIHFPVTKVVSLENTCNRGGGAIYAFDEMARIKEVCVQNGLILHLDGARLFNALVEADYTATQCGQLFDTISICLSKGLGAPVGSLLLGSHENIKAARRVRKVLGGGMRQAGFLAAAGIHALDHHVGRLKEDHARARQLGATVQSLPYVEELFAVDTNILVFRLADTVKVPDYLEHLRSRGIWATGFGGQLVRFVTHLDFTDAMMEPVEQAVKAFR